MEAETGQSQRCPFWWMEEKTGQSKKIGVD